MRLPLALLLLLTGCAVASAEPTATVTVFAAGDIADCTEPGDEKTADLLDTLAGPGDTILTLGDNAYERGRAAEFRDCYGPTWGRFLPQTRPGIGNHEYLTNQAAPYFDYFGKRAGPGKGWYSFNVGAWHVVMLNSEKVTAAQLSWLDADLSATSKACILAAWHHPRYASGGKTDDASVEPFWDRLVADGRTPLILNGHDHNYQRYEQRGVVQIIAGTGGRHFYDLRPDPRRLAGHDRTWGVVEVDLSPGGFAWTFRPVAGSAWTDTGTGTC